LKVCKRVVVSDTRGFHALQIAAPGLVTVHYREALTIMGLIVLLSRTEYP
jgi:hypothetical protein